MNTYNIVILFLLTLCCLAISFSYIQSISCSPSKFNKENGISSWLFAAWDYVYQPQHYFT